MIAIKRKRQYVVLTRGKKNFHNRRGRLSCMERFEEKLREEYGKDYENTFTPFDDQRNVKDILKETHQ